MTALARHGIRRAAALLLAVAAAAGLASAEGDGPEPYVGYVYPAGGRRGTKVRVTAGGQFLAGADAVRVSGEGVSATIVRGAVTPREQREIRLRLDEIREARRAARQEAGAPKDAAAAARRERVPLPRHPLLDRFDVLTGPELQEVAALFLHENAGGKRQPNRQLGDTVEIEVDVEPSAAPGTRELRLVTQRGLTNPVRFEVGSLPEAVGVKHYVLPDPPLAASDLPVLVNGQIHPGDADRVRFRARKGQRLVLAARARALVPFLADAVPGWFQAVLAVRDASGRELAFGDDWRFDPDPVVRFRVPADGEYTAEVRDALWRGREDFVYRLAIAEEPFPAGPAQPSRSASVADESEPNDDADHAQAVVLPAVVEGRFGVPGDVDLLRFEGRAGDEVVCDVEARRIGSPADTVVRLCGPSGAVVAWNDDREAPNAGLLTHHADSYLRATLPAAGRYLVRLAEAQRHGSADHAYRIRIAPPRRDFELFVTPASVNVGPGRTAVIRAWAVRKDGFDGPIDVEVGSAVGPLARGVVLSGGRIPAGVNSVRMTLAVPPDLPAGPVALQFTGVARDGAAELRHDAVPAEDATQAFAYHHLVPAQELLVSAAPSGRSVAAAVVTALPVRLRAGGAALVEVRVAGMRPGTDLRPELDDPPAGVVLEDWAFVAGGLTLVLRADAAGAKAGTRDNLIVELVDGRAPAGRTNAARAARRSAVRAVLPAIPVVIVAE